jgi:invasion protein IalB
VDQGQPISAPYAECIESGCIATYVANAELIKRLAGGTGLVVQVINSAGRPVSIPFPLAEFGNAYNDPASVTRPQKTFASVALTGREQLFYTPWAKICRMGNEANARNGCFTGKDGAPESGPGKPAVVAAVIIEPDGDARKTLRVTLPLGMSLISGTIIVIDQGPQLSGPYVSCFKNGCLADYVADTVLINRLKNGRTLTVQGVSNRGSQVVLHLPLADFNKAFDGPPTDPTAFQQARTRRKEQVERFASQKPR